MSQDQSDSSELLRGKRLAFVGRLASMGRREAGQLVRRYGATVLDEPDASANLVVLGEEGLPAPEEESVESWLDDASRAALEAGALELITETQLWQRLGLVDPQPDIHRLYTPAMLAELLGVSVAVIRRWHRRGLIAPACEVRRLPYFDFHEVATAQRLAQLLAAGASPRAIEKKLAGLARWLPGVARPLAQLSVIVHGKQILLRQGDGLVEPGGQYRFDFEAWENASPPGEVAKGEDTPPLAAAAEAHVNSAEEMCRLAAELEEAGELAPAAEMYRAAWSPPVRRRKSVSSWPNSSTGWAIGPPPANATIWSSNWTRTWSKPARTWGACWRSWASGSWPPRPSRGRCVITPATPTCIFISRGR